MNSYKQTFSDLTGYLGIGSLIIFGGFLIFDALFGIQQLIEHYAGTATWSALVAIPVLVIAYILGVFAVSICELLFEPFFNKISNINKIFSRVAAIKNDILTDRFVELERNRRLISGASLAFIVLAIGSLLEKRFMPGIEGLAYIGCILGILCALACPILATKLYKNTISLVQSMEDHIKKPKESV